MVSVIIPTHNRAELVREAIQSVLKQTYTSFEIWVVDDGSTDNTAEVIKDLGDSRIHYLYKENSGYPAPARNMGMLKSKGKYIAFLDSDDLWMLEKLERQVGLLENRKDVSIVSSNMRNMGSDQASMLIENDYFVDISDIYKKGNPIANSSVVMRREVFEKVGLKDESPDIIVDIDYWLRALKEGFLILVMKDVLLKYRVHDGNISEAGKFCYAYRKKFENVLFKHLDYDSRTLLHCYKKVKYSHYLVHNLNLLRNSNIGLKAFLRNRELKPKDKLKAIVKRLLRKV